MDLGIIKAGELIMALGAAIGFDGSKVRRVVIDAESMELVKVYIEMFGSSKLLQVDWVGGLDGAEITVADRGNDGTA